MNEWRRRLHRDSGPARGRAIARVLVASSIAVLLVACRSSPDKTEKDADKHQVGHVADPLALAADVRSFARSFCIEVAGNAAAIAAQTHDPVVREATLRWRLDAIPQMNLAALSPDPRTALAWAWALSTRQRFVITSDAGHPPFGDQNPAAERVARDLERRIAEIAAKYVAPEDLPHVAARIEQFASRGDIHAEFRASLEAEAADESSSGGGGLSGVLSLPLAPFQGLQGVGDTPAELRRLSLVAGDWAILVASLPDQMRWQVELVALSLDDLETLKSVRSIAATAAEISKTAQALPERVGTELRTTLADSSHELDTIRATALEAHATVDGISVAVEKARMTIEEVKPAAEALTHTMNAATGLVEAVHAAFPPAEKSAASSAAPPAPEKPFDMAEVTRAAERLDGAVVELRGLVSDVGSDSSRRALDQTSQRIDALVDRIFTRALALVVVAAVLGAALILLRRMRAPATAKTS
jgi:hypothetical protein